MKLFFAFCAFSVTVSSVICYKVKRVYASSGSTNGLFWDSSTCQLIFEDTYKHKLCFLRPLEKNAVSCALLGKRLPAFAVPVEQSPKISNQFAVGADNDILLITWDGKDNSEAIINKKLTSVDLKVNGNRINYGTVSSSNRLWFGTINKINGVVGLNKASVYSLDSSLLLKTQISPVSFSSGMVWSLNNDKLYFVDSLTYQVAAYDYDSKLGTVANREVVFDLKTNKIPGNPGRLAIDTDGNLWVPIYEGSRVIKVNPKTKELLQTVTIPAKRVAACTFGGPKLKTLYVSTVGYGIDDPTEVTPANDKEGGSIYRVTGLGVKGLQTKPFKLR